MQRKDLALAPFLETHADELDDFARCETNDLPVVQERDVLREAVAWRVAGEGRGELVEGGRLEGGDLRERDPRGFRGGLEGFGLRDGEP